MTAAAIASASSGSTIRPQWVSSTMERHRGKSEQMTGTHAAMYSNILVG